MKWHRRLVVLSASALLVWGGSGLIHTFLSSFGVQQAAFAPPARVLDLSEAMPIADILRKAGVERAAAVRVVVGEQENLLQVTERQNAPRRYFRLRTGEEIPDQDKLHAAFLARHYMGFPEVPVERVETVHRFSADYPAVNRLLPVYKVSFAREDNLHVYIYTETGAVAGVSNTLKQRLQTVFQWLHTGSYWPESMEWLRVGLFTLWVGALFLMAVTGLVLLLRIRRPKRVGGKKGMHRLAAYVVAVPTLVLSFSGIFHLLQNGGSAAVSALRLQQPLLLDGLDFKLNTHWKGLSEGTAFSGLSLVQTDDGRWLYRLALALPKGHAPVGPAAIRNARFDGVSPVGNAVYLRADTGEIWPEGDLEIAHQLAAKFTGITRANVRNVEWVTRFGGDYDFRNKRLPVWRFDYGVPLDASVFIDTATGVLADMAPHSGRPERWTFSVLHKWNFLAPLGRDIQNFAIAFVVLLAMLAMAGLGIAMRLKGKGQNNVKMGA